jgi:hypothetical protein
VHRQDGAQTLQFQAKIALIKPPKLDGIFTIFRFGPSETLHYPWPRPKNHRLVFDP